MKLQCVELPIMKNQARKTSKTPKLAPLVAVALFLLTIIPIYYPFLRYSHKNSSSDLSSSSRIPLCRDGDDDLASENGLCSDEEVQRTPTTNDDQRYSTETSHQGNKSNEDIEKQPALTTNDNQHDSPETAHQDEDRETNSTLTNPDLVESTTQSDQNEMWNAFNRDKKINSIILSNPELVGKTQEGVIENVFNRDMETLNNPESIKTTQSEEDVNETPIDRDMETKPVVSSLELVERIDSGGRETSFPPDRDENTTRTLRRRDVGKSTPPPSKVDESDMVEVAERENCDLFSGEWVPNQDAPYYTNMTCSEIQQHQDCLKFGRPDTQYLKWKWKPEGCELPVFDPFKFLQHVRGKSLAFVGDSVARNHMQSLICLLSRVEEPVDVSDIKYVSQFKRYEFPNHNFSMEIFWSPYLVKTTQTDNSTLTRPLNLFLDEFDEKWTTKIQHFDFVIISAGHWFFRPTMFYVHGRIVGCLYCQESNITHLTSYFSYRRAFRTAFRAINSLENFKGITFLRTFAPSHFEGGYWDKGGDCVRTRPFKNGEARLEGYNLEHYKIQIEELKIATRLGRSKGLKFRLFDVTQAMLLRPDGHPSKYGHWPQPNASLANDCVHWCLPGPVDTWNDFLIELLKREEKA